VRHRHGEHALERRLVWSEREYTSVGGQLKSVLPYTSGGAEREDISKRLRKSSSKFCRARASESTQTTRSVPMRCRATTGRGTSWCTGRQRSSRCHLPSWGGGCTRLRTPILLRVTCRALGRRDGPWEGMRRGSADV